MTDAVKPLALAEIVSEMRSLAEMNLHLNGEASRDLLTQLANKLEHCTPPAGWKPIVDENTVTLDKRDLFDFVRGAIRQALEEETIDDAAELWSNAHDRTVECLTKLLPAAPENDDEQT